MVRIKIFRPLKWNERVKLETLVKHFTENDHKILLTVIIKGMAVKPALFNPRKYFLLDKEGKKIAMIRKKPNKDACTDILQG